MERREFVHVAGTSGHLELANAFLPGTDDVTIDEMHGRNDANVHVVTGVDEYQLMVQHFGECILTGQPVRYSLSEAAANMRVIEALYRSARADGTPRKSSDCVMHIDVRRHDSDAGKWEFARGTPHDMLDGLILGYTGFIQERASFQARRELPKDRLSLIISFDTPVRVMNPRVPNVVHDLYGSFVTGYWDTYAITELAHDWSGLQVDFSPLGAYRILQLPMGDLHNRVVGLDAIVSPCAVDKTPGAAERDGQLEGTFPTSRSIFLISLGARQGSPFGHRLGVAGTTPTSRERGDRSFGSAHRGVAINISLQDSATK